MACGTALWESLVRKSPEKASRESHRSHDPREGKRDTAATAREENPRAYPHSRRGMTPLGDSRGTQDPCQHWRGILRIRHRLHTSSQGPASTGEESREAPEQLAWVLALPEATRGRQGQRQLHKVPGKTVFMMESVLELERFVGEEWGGPR